MDMDRIKVLVADSSEIYALGLFHSLAENERIKVLNSTYDGQGVIDKVEKLKPDIVVIDSQLPEQGGIRVTEMLQEMYPEVKAIILTPPEKAEALFDSAINAGAKGFLSKTVKPTELVKGVIETANGGVAICPTMIPLLLEKLAERRQKKTEVEILLTTREREVMELVAKGISNHEIAVTLFISENTVKGHIRKIIDKLKVHNRVEMARYVLLNK